MSTINASKVRCPDIRIVGDTEMLCAIELYDSDGTLLDLSGATATFSFRDADGTIVSSELTCTITGSVVAYGPTVSDAVVSTVGTYIGRFKVTLADSTIMKLAVEYQTVTDL